MPSELFREEPSRSEIWKMFDRISTTYDKVNRWMTFGRDAMWRKEVALRLPNLPSMTVLDCATGTADQLVALLENGSIDKAYGVDLSEEMLKIAKRKIENKPYKEKVHLKKASALALPFSDEMFDCVTISFGIRNVTDVKACFREIYRVLKKGGRLLILESSMPEGKCMRALHLFYLRHILPKMGGILSKDKQAYIYLNKTIETFPYGRALCKLLEECHFHEVEAHPLFFGAVSIYQADKK